MRYHCLGVLNASTSSNERKFSVKTTLFPARSSPSHRVDLRSMHLHGNRLFTCTTLLAVMACASYPAHARDKNIANCGERGQLAVQILGSGGPEVAGGRASSAYLVWWNGGARLMIDAGAGSFLRFGESGAHIEDLWHIGLTHLHVDHSVDLVSFTKAGFFTDRTDALSISGPTAGGVFPAVDVFLRRLFGHDGAYAYLAGALDGSGGHFRLEPMVVSAAVGEQQSVLKKPEFLLDSIGVRHGPVPSLAYRLTAGATTVAFAGDQDAASPAFWHAVRGADVLIVHLAIADDRDAVAATLHATPQRLAVAAAQAKVKHLVLAHLMKRSLAGIETAIRSIGTHYAGAVSVATDGACVELH